MASGKRSFFDGRYGVDPFSVFVLFVAAMLLTSRFWMIWIISGLMLIYVVFRALSRHVDARRRELQGFYDISHRAVLWLQRAWFGVTGFFRRIGPKLAERRDFVVFKCPHCKAKLRLPRHRGKLAVTCTVCGHQFIRRT